MPRWLLQALCTEWLLTVGPPSVRNPKISTRDRLDQSSILFPPTSGAVRSKSTLPGFMSNIAHPEGYLRAHCDTNGGLLVRRVVLPRSGLISVSEHFGVQLYRMAHSWSWEMMDWIARAQRNPNARMTGVIYLIYFLMAIPAQFLIGRKFIFYGNAINLIATAFYAVLTLLFYGMFRPVNRRLSLLAALFSLAGCTVMTLDLFLSSLPVSSLLFFGPYCLLIGYLIFMSSFLPRILGLLMALAGLGWVAFLFPTIRHSLTLYIEVFGIFAEASLMLWLLVMGVNVQRWKEQAGTSGKPPSIDIGRCRAILVNRTDSQALELVARIRWKEFERNCFDETLSPPSARSLPRPHCGRCPTRSCIRRKGGARWRDPESLEERLVNISRAWRDCRR